MGTPKRLLVVGGVAGGASAAARARRLNEDCEIVLFDRGPYVSFANCGLPYYVGDVITDEAKLIVATPELFKRRFDIEVRTRVEVTVIDPARKVIAARALDTGVTSEEHYDALVLSPGASPIRPPLPGIDAPGVFVVRTIPDTRSIREWMTERGASRAVIVGGGFIGLEMAENLARRGLAVTIVEQADHVMPPVDPELAVLLEEHLRANGVSLALGAGLRRIDETPRGLCVGLASGAVLETDLVILGIGVRPETSLAKSAGLALGPRGGIKVDAQMRTSVPGIWAVGDAVEVHKQHAAVEVILPLAGPANRQGRVAAGSIFGRDTVFRGVRGTAVCGVFELTVAVTGCSERSLTAAGATDFYCVYLHPGSHASYFPGASPIHLKLIARRSDGVVLGAQAVGRAGVERRIDAISMAMQAGATVEDLEEAELCYAPQYGAAKDPVNVAGMIANNVRHGDMPLLTWNELRTSPEPGLLLDVRTAAEFARGTIPGAVNIPLEELRDRLGELPAGRELWVFCQVGQRGYFATRLLLQRGFSARNLSGGYATYGAFAALAASP